MAADAVPSREGRRELLRADCENCFGLCCVALAFTRSTDFAVDKGAGEPCTNLRDDFSCGIHERLRPSGFKGCTVFECYGAGQRVAQVTFEGKSWSEAPETKGQMFSVFPVVRQLHEMLWYLSEALNIPQAHALRREIGAAYTETEKIAQSGPDVIMSLDVGALRDGVNKLLVRASALARASVGKDADTSKIRRTMRPGADLVGASLKGQDLRGTDLRGAYLIAADLRQADLRWADLIGADLRDANLGSADLSESLFLTQFQVNSTKGNSKTKLPSSLAVPSHWVR